MNSNNQDEILFATECSGYNYQPSIIGPRRRIIAIGDIHGDYKLMIDCLKLAKVIDDKDNWIGGDTVVVQVGDQIDRCRPMKVPGGECDKSGITYDDEGSDIVIMEYLTNLDKKARKDQGYVYSLLGNHELMNVQGNMDYVSKAGIDQFNNTITGLSGMEARKKLFQPGEKYAKFMACTRLSTVFIGSYLFVHAGLTPKFLKENNIEKREDLIRLNREVRKWLLGEVNEDNVDKIVSAYQDKQSMFWVRLLGRDDQISAEDIDEVLDLFKIGKMVIGHTPQFMFNKGINQGYDGRIVRVDVGSSKAFENQTKHNKEIMDLRKVQVLEILNDTTINILK